MDAYDLRTQHLQDTIDLLYPYDNTMTDKPKQLLYKLVDHSIELKNLEHKIDHETIELIANKRQGNKWPSYLDTNAYKYQQLLLIEVDIDTHYLLEYIRKNNPEILL